VINVFSLKEASRGNVEKPREIELYTTLPDTHKSKAENNKSLYLLGLGNYQVEESRTKAERITCF